LFTFKGVSGGGDFMVREEIEEEVGGDKSLPEWVEEVARKGGLEVRFPPSQLKPVLRVDNRRTVLPLSGEDGTQIEVSQDDVRFQGSSVEARHQELEVELKSGSERRFGEFCSWIKTTFRLEPSTESKYRRGVRTVYGVERPGGGA
jgi:inorganic triphosphatase YgiF